MRMRLRKEKEVQALAAETNLRSDDEQRDVALIAHLYTSVLFGEERHPVALVKLHKDGKIVGGRDLTLRHGRKHQKSALVLTSNFKTGRNLALCTQA